MKNLTTKLAFALLTFLLASYGHACTISEDMHGSLPLNSIDIPNSARLEIAEMVIAARQWPDTQIRGIVYAGGYIKERNPTALAEKRASELKNYLIRLGVLETNIWIDVRVIKKPDVDSKGNEALNQIAVTLVPICVGGCERLCEDSRVMPNSKIIK